MTKRGVRPGGWHDVPEVMPVMKSSFDPVYGEAWSQSQLSGLLMGPGNFMLLLEADDRVVGFAVGRSTLDEAELMLLAVIPEMRGHGFGEFLLRNFIEEARRRGVRRIFLEMRADNERALSLYGKAGFIPVGHRPRYYRGADGVLRDAITMTLTMVNSVQ